LLGARRWRFAAGLAALAGAVGLAWWLGTWQRADGDKGSAATVVQAAVPASTAARLASALSSGKSAASALSASAPRVADTDSVQDEDATHPAAEPVWDLCGVGRMPKPAHAAVAASAHADAASEDLPAHLGSDGLLQARQALWRALDAGSPRWRAAAMALRSLHATGSPAAPELPALSLAAVDPVVDLWALHSCGGNAACAEPLARRWAQHDANNLAAWAAVLEWTPAPQQDEIVARMAQTPRFETYWPALSAAVLQAMPDEVPAYLQVMLLEEAVAVSSLWLGSPRPIITYCREPMTAGSTAFTHCAAIARVMVEHSDATFGALVGLRLAERTYLPASEAQRQRDAINAAAQSPDHIFDTQQPYSCTGVQRMRNWVQQLAAHGELGALKVLAQRRAASAPGR
jgi:hypothetical protein